MSLTHADGPDGISIRRADPTSPDIARIIAAHLAHSRATTPEASIHAMSVEQMAAQPGLAFWAIYDGGEALGCGALKPLDDGTVEVKSVHVLAAARGRGLARAMMKHLEVEARRDGHRAMVLETGSDQLTGFEAARALYASLGFTDCGPFEGYEADPNSAFMRHDL